ncbi:MAG: hypothetical protein Q8R92_05325 [Deltaproteobacteria bacterium]|nr:hypothetical protein [Deltaproteobacteria bacterium]
MPTVRNPVTGGLLVASASNVSEGQLVLRDGAIAGPGNALGVLEPIMNFRVAVPSTNLPRLCWSLLLQTTFTDSVLGAFAAQVGITWQPFINGRAATAPLLLPIGVPVDLQMNCASEWISVNIVVPLIGAPPPAAPTGLNSILFNISAAQ